MIVLKIPEKKKKKGNKRTCHEQLLKLRKFSESNFFKETHNCVKTVMLAKDSLSRPVMPADDARLKKGRIIRLRRRRRTRTRTRRNNWKKKKTTTTTRRISSRTTIKRKRRKA